MLREVVLRKEIELMLQLDESDNKIIKLKDSFKDIPSTIERLQKEIDVVYTRLVSEKEQYDEEKVELSYVADEINELNKKFDNIQKQINKDTTLGKDVTALQKLLDDEKKKKAIKDEEFLSSQAIVKDLEEVYTEVSTAYTKTKLENEKTIAELEENIKTYSKDIKEIEESKSLLFKDLQKYPGGNNLVETYLQVADAFAGQVVSKVENDSCSRCFMQITPQLLNDLQREGQHPGDKMNLITCPSCSCILYYDIEE